MNFKLPKTQEEAVQINFDNLMEYLANKVFPLAILERPDLFKLKETGWQYRLIHNAPAEEF